MTMSENKFGSPAGIYPTTMKHLFLIMAAVGLSGCHASVGKDFNEQNLAIFKKLQGIIRENPDALHGTESNFPSEYGWVVESNFNRLFGFLAQEDKDAIMKLFQTKQLARIEIENQNCILFKIRPDYENSLFWASWDELYIAYYNDCPCVCHRKINWNEVPPGKIIKLENNWFKVIARDQRYIGG